MNLKDEEWEPEPTDQVLLRKTRIAAKSTVSTHDLANLRASLLAPPYNGAIPHEVRGTIWLLLLRLRSEDLLAEDANAFAQQARKAVTEDNSKEQIEKDVDRTRPGLARFKQPAVRGALLRLLSLFCARRNVAYVQGFNELLAPFVLLADTGGNPRVVYALFAEFVSKFAPWMLETSETRVFDVLKRLFKYFGRLLLYHDPELYWLLERHMMTPDLYATSWFVTLFARNFTVESVLALWDLLLLEDNPLGTSFFGVALLCSKRQELLTVDESRIPETLMLLTANSPEEVRKLWRVGSEMRSIHTPPSFQRLMTDRLLDTPQKPTKMAISAARSMQASVCLQTTPDDLLAGDAHYFTWDCRTEAEYNSGHLAQAAHLCLDALREANGKITAETSEAARLELQTAVDLCEPLKGSTHICLVGSGVREEDNMDINMLALYLTRIGIPYVSTLRGGFRGALEAVKAGEALSSVELVDYDLDRHDEARRDRVSNQLTREASLVRTATESDSRNGVSSEISPKRPTREERRALRNSQEKSKRRQSKQSASSFLEKSDAEVSRALNSALIGSNLRYTLSTTSEAASNEKDVWETELSPDGTSLANRFNPFSPNSRISPTSSIGTSGTDTPSKQISDGLKREYGNELNEANRSSNPFRRSNSTQLGGTQQSETELGRNALRRRGVMSVENSPRLMETPSRLISPRPGLANDPNQFSSESPIRKKQNGMGISQPQESTWGRNATPGWLGEETLSYPLSSMAKGFTVNVMDDRVMAGLRLFPCKAKSSRSTGFRGRAVEYKKRFVGVSAHYFLLLGPHNNRNHVLEVKILRYLQDISRITFKRSRPELVTFEITSGPEDNETVETVECVMPDGLKECVTLIKDYIEEEEEQEQDSNTEMNSSKSEHSTADDNRIGQSVGVAAGNSGKTGSRGSVVTAKWKTAPPISLQDASGKRKSKPEAGNVPKSGASPKAAFQNNSRGEEHVEEVEFGDFQAAPVCHERCG